MYKSFITILFAILVLNSCKKASDENPQPVAPVDTTSNNNNNNNNNNNGSGITAVPGSFQQKVLLEEFAGAWCTTSPDADYKRDQVVSANPGKVIAVAVHETDGMTISSLYNTLYTSFSANTPSGMINRTPSLSNVALTPSQWMSNATVALGKTAKCGVAIKSTVTGTTASIEVHAGFKQTLTGNYNLTVYLVQDSVTGTGSGYNQANAYNNSSGSPFYGLGNPIINYKHNRVIKKVLSANLGDAIPADKLVASGDFVKTFSADISGYNQNYLYVVGFVNKLGTSPTTHEIMNVQQAKIATLKNWE